MPQGPSQANTGYLGTFSTGTNASPPVYTAMAEIGSIKLTRYTVPEINCTHLLSPNTTEELTPGLLMPGTIELSGNFIGDATQLAIDALAQAQTVFPFKVTTPVQNRIKTATLTGLCFLTKNEIGPVEPNKKLDFSVSAHCSGFVTCTVA